MEKELAHSFNIKLEPKISQEIRDEQNKLLGEFKELRFYDSSPHLAIATKFMGEKDTEKFIKSVNNEFYNDKSWYLEFGDFYLSEGSENSKYIFLNLSPKSTQYILELNQRLLRSTKNIGFETPQNLHAKYPYYPHLSIIKLQFSEASKAIKLIEKDFRDTKMLVTHYELTRQQEDKDGFSKFPIISEIILK